MIGLTDTLPDHPEMRGRWFDLFKVRAILTDQDLHTRMSEAGLERSRRYSWDICAKQTLEVLERVYREHRGERTAAGTAGA